MSPTLRAPRSRSRSVCRLGGGWFSWFVVPPADGRPATGVGWRAAPLDLGSASACDDHNWGRWHWGDDLGWDWGAFLAPEPGPASCSSDDEPRAQRAGGAGAGRARRRRRRSFAGALRLERSGALGRASRRCRARWRRCIRTAPVRPSRAAPAAWRRRRRLGRAWFTARAAAQLIAADPAVRGYAFVQESVGEFTCSGRIGRTSFRESGLGVVERAD